MRYIVYVLLAIFAVVTSSPASTAAKKRRPRKSVSKKTKKKRKVSKKASKKKKVKAKSKKKKEKSKAKAKKKKANTKSKKSNKRKGNRKSKKGNKKGKKEKPSLWERKKKAITPKQLETIVKENTELKAMLQGRIELPKPDKAAGPMLSASTFDQLAAIAVLQKELDKALYGANKEEDKAHVKELQDELLMLKNHFLTEPEISKEQLDKLKLIEAEATLLNYAALSDGMKSNEIEEMKEALATARAEGANISAAQLKRIEELQQELAKKIAEEEKRQRMDFIPDAKDIPEEELTKDRAILNRIEKLKKSEKTLLKAHNGDGQLSSNQLSNAVRVLREEIDFLSLYKGSQIVTPENFDKGIVFSVQISASKGDDLSNVASDVLTDGTEGNFKQDKVNGLYLHAVGHFRNYWRANKLKKYLRKVGVRDAYIVAFKEGKKISINKKEILKIIKRQKIEKENAEGK